MSKPSIFKSPLLWLAVCVAMVCAALASGCGGAAAQSTPLPTVKVGVMGDSISAGYTVAGGIPQLAQAQAWPSMLPVSVQAVNVSVGGFSTADAAGYEVNALSRTRLDWLVLEFGINDARQGIGPAAYLSGLRALLASHPEARAVVIKPTYWTSDLDARITDLRAELDQLAGPRVVVVDPLGGRRDWTCSDLDLHPCFPAHQAIAQAVTAAIWGAS